MYAAVADPADKVASLRQVVRSAGEELVLGLRVESKHCNARGTVHGGILATLADTALGYAMAFSTTPPLSLATANLTLDFVGTAKPGDWLEAHVDVQKTGIGWRSPTAIC